MKVQELLNSEDKWTTGAYARDKDEEPVSSDAVKWCITGAIHKCYPSERTKIIDKVENAVGTNIIAFNDSHTYEEVMKVVKELDL